MQRRSSLRSIFFIALAIAAGSLFSAYSRQNSWEDEARKRKASYCYIQAIDAFMNERYNLYGDLLTLAYELDPQDHEIKTRMGEWKILSNSNDSASVEDGFAMMFDGYKNKKDDYFEGIQLLNLTSNYRRWDDNLKVAEEMAQQFPTRNEIALQLGKSYLMHAMMGDTSYISRTVNVISNLEEKVGKSSQLSEYKIRAFAIINDTASIVNELQALNAASPTDPYTAMALGQVYSSLGRPDSALHYFNRACELDSTNGSAIMLRAQFYQQQGDSTTFDDEAFRAIKSQDLELDAKMKLLVNYINMLYEDTTQHTRIDSLFEVMLDANPGEADVHRLYAEFLAKTDKTERAADQMSYAVALDGTSQNSWLLLAQLYSDIKDYDKAAETMEEASKMLPGEYVFIRPHAAFLSLAGKTGEAIEVLETFPDSTLTDAEEISQYQSLLGDLYYQDKQKNKAFAAYGQALKANPYNYQAMNNVAYYYAETDTLLDQAESYAARVVRHDPDNTTYLDTYAWVLYKKGNFEEAKEQIDRTLRILNFDLAIDSLDATLDSVDMHDDHNNNIEDYESTLQYLEKNAKEMQAEQQAVVISADVLDHAGDIYFRCGDINKAVKFWEKALERSPENAEKIKNKIKHRKILEDAP